jgi:outer membrane receptor protein involved in Fe transport
VIVAITVLGTGQAYAQVAGATLTGTVKDSSGGVIPNAQVAITDVATAVTRTVSSGGAGLYNAPNLLPGTYEVRVTAMGFSTEVQKGITLTVGAQQELDFTMQVGQMTQTVEITTEAPTVELTSSTLSATVNATTVRELPLNGRSWTDLANLQPGVFSAESHLHDQNRGYGDQSVISGARPQQNNYRLDGISINDYANGGPGSLLGGNLGVDAIQEFSVLTSNYSAEYGKTSGGVVNAITRSGTNQIHGSVYEFLRNSALDADNFFDNATGTPKPAFRRNQFGVAAGGPIRKDRTFIFGDYEGIRQSLGTTNSPVVLSSDARLGIVNDSCGNAPGTRYKNTTDFGTCTTTPGGAYVPNPILTGPCLIPGTMTPNPNAKNLAAGQSSLCVDNSVAKYLPLEPIPTGKPFGDGNVALASFAGQKVDSENYFTIRVDQKLSEKDNLFGTYNFDRDPQSVPDLLNQVLNNGIAKRQFIALEESHIFGAGLVNTARVGFNRARVGGVPGTAINLVAADTSLGWLPGAGRTAPQAFVTGLTQIGNGASPTSYRNWNSYQAYDDAFLTRGLHSLKFGFGFERDQLNEVDLTADYHGIFNFGSPSTFLTNQPSRFSGGFPGLPGQRGMRQSIVGAYVQDDWRVRPNLTLNLGVRYEMSTVPIEAHANLTNLYNVTDEQPTCARLFTSPTGVSCGATGTYFSNPTLRNFEPRIGFSWDPFKNGKTALRGGFGMFDVLPMLYTTITMVGRGAPFTEIGATSNASKLSGKFPGGVDPNKDLGPHNLEYEHVEQKPPRNYVMQWNLNLQRELAPNLTMVVGFAGSHGVHQALRVDDANIVFPAALTSAGYLWPNPIGTGNQINTFNSGAIRSLFWAGDSFYSALEVGVVKKMSRGFQVQGSFTWGKSIDNNSGATNGDTFANAFSSIHWDDLRTSRAVSDYNIPRVLVINANWHVPTSKSASRAVAFVANGWELGAIFKVNDGYPFTPTFGSTGDPLGLNSSDPWAFPNRLRTPDCATLINPRNTQNYLKTQCFAVPTAPCPAGTDALTCPFYNGTASNGIGCDPTPPIGPKGAPEPVPFPECFNLAGSSGRNPVYGPGLTNLDFSVFKNNSIRRISESFNAQFRVEVFNILNHANFAPPTVSKLDVFDPTGKATSTAGLLTATTTDPRQIQFALKLTW